MDCDQLIIVSFVQLIAFADILKVLIWKPNYLRKCLFFSLISCLFSSCKEIIEWSYKGKWNISTVSWPEIHTFVNYNYKCFSPLLHLNNICLTLENLVENTIITPFTIWLPLCLILHPSLKIAKLTSIFFLTLFVRFDVMQWSWLMSWAERSVHVFKANLHGES